MGCSAPAEPLAPSTACSGKHCSQMLPSQTRPDALPPFFQGFAFDYPGGGSWVVAFDRSGSTGNGAVVGEQGTEGAGALPLQNICSMPAVCLQYALLNSLERSSHQLDAACHAMSDPNRLPTPIALLAVVGDFRKLVTVSVFRTETVPEAVRQAGLTEESG